jgi:hypothetical protein
MGRWSGYQLKRNTNSNLNIITAYRPIITQGIHTSYQQQRSILLNKGVNNPDPRQQILDDLATLITEFNNNFDTTILMIDANEGLFTNHSKLTTFLAQTNLTSLIQHTQHHPATHCRGTQCIDYIFGTNTIIEHVVQSGMTPFYDSPWPFSDHRGLFIDIHYFGLLGASTHSLLPKSPKRLSSLSKTMVQKFINTLEQTNRLPALLEELYTINRIQTWTEHEHNTLEAIDIEFTNILLTAEKDCAIISQYPWSPELHQKSLIYTYWLIHLKGNNNNINVLTQLNTISEKITDYDLYQNNRQRQSLAQLRLARKNLINCQLESHQKRDQFLNIQHQLMVEEGRMTQAKAIQQKIYREQQRRCWALLRNMIHGTKTAGASHMT